MEKESAEVELTGEQLLDMLQKQVEESYGLKVAARGIEQDDTTKKLSGVFMLEGRIGYVKVETDLKAE